MYLLMITRVPVTCSVATHKGLLRYASTNSVISTLQLRSNYKPAAGYKLQCAVWWVNDLGLYEGLQLNMELRMQDFVAGISRHRSSNAALLWPNVSHRVPSSRHALGGVQYTSRCPSQQAVIGHCKGGATHHAYHAC